jgi:hypothetical protein
MTHERFVRLAKELAERDRDLAAQIEEARKGAARLRDVIAEAVEAFRGEVRDRGSAHLANVTVGPVEPDGKHVDCVQVRVQRGRSEALVVAKAEGKVTLVGPYKRGKPEKPCVDYPLVGAEVERGAEDLVEKLIREASKR